MGHLSQIITPTLASVDCSASGHASSIVKRLSCSSMHSLAELLASASSSSTSIGLAEDEVVTEEGLRHAEVKLEPR